MIVRSCVEGKSEKCQEASGMILVYFTVRAVLVVVVGAVVLVMVDVVVVVMVVVCGVVLCGV